MLGKTLVKITIPQTVLSALGTVAIPSHVTSQLVAFPADVLRLDLSGGQGEHTSPSLKWLGLQTGNNKRTDSSCM